MRKLLKSHFGERGTYTGSVECFGTKHAYRGPDKLTILLHDVKDAEGNIVTDHLWMTVGTQIERLCLRPGDQVEFCARVTSYVKGYRGRRDDVYGRPVSSDYRLSYPTKMRKLSAQKIDGQEHIPRPDGST